MAPMAITRETTTVVVKICSSTVTAEELASRLGVKPDLSWKAGAARGTFRVVEKQHGFVLESKLLPTNNSVDEHVLEMIKRLSPCAQTLGALANEVTVEFTCSVARRTPPFINIGRDQLRWLAVMGARLIIETAIVVDQNKTAPAPPGKPGQP